MLIAPDTAAKNGSLAVANLGQNQWADVKVTLTGVRAGQTAGLYFKVVDLTSNLSRFRLYFTSVARVNATYNALGPVGSTAFEQTLANNFPTSTAADFAPLEAGIVDEDTYVEQGLKWKDAHFAYLHYIFDTLGLEPDLLQLGTPITDEFGHQFTALFTKEDLDGDPNPYYDDVNGDGVRDHRVAAREGYIRAAYEEGDETLALGRELMGEDDTTVFASSDHGMAPQWYAVNAGKVLLERGFRPSSRTATAAGSRRCLPGRRSRRVTPADGGVLRQSRRPPSRRRRSSGRVRGRSQSDHPGLPEPGRPGEPRKAGRPGRAAQGAARQRQRCRCSQRRAERRPVMLLRPPYQFDAATPGQRIAFSQFFGQHGYLPNLVNLARNVNMHGTFVAAGPGIRGGGHGDDDDDDDDDGGGGNGGRKINGVQAVDVAPTIAFLMDIEGPTNATGRVLFEALED